MKRRSTVIVRVPYTPVPRQYKSLEEVWNGADGGAEQSRAQPPVPVLCLRKKEAKYRKL